MPKSTRAVRPVRLRVQLPKKLSDAFKRIAKAEDKSESQLGYEVIREWVTTRNVGLS